MGYRHVLTGDYTAQPTVYKLNFGKKYYIFKGKNLFHSVETICNDIDRFLSRGVKDDHLLKKVVEYVKRARILFCKVDVLLQTDNLAHLIEFENLTLAKAKEDPDCLNWKFKAHVPKWIPETGAAAESTSTQNKPITDTFISPVIQVPIQEEKIKPVVKEIAPEPKSAPASTSRLMEALAKLKK